jgi:hypothetical protein
MNSKTSLPYEPLAPCREEKVGIAKVTGNDSFATVCRVGLVDTAVEIFDNDPNTDEPDSGSSNPSAFERAKLWAWANQDLLKPVFHLG